MRIWNRREILKSVLLFSLLSIGYNARLLSDTSKLKALLNSSHRPTIHDVYKALDYNIPHTNPLGSSPKKHDIDSNGPWVIAELEGAFPGGTYACLGRDSFLIADILSAYYLAMGLSDEHVERLHASTATVHQLRVSGTAGNFLATNGLSANRPSYVIIDRTSFSNTSQSTILYNAAEQWVTDHGAQQRIAVVSTQSGSDYRTFLKSRNAQVLHASNFAAFTDVGFWTQTYGGSFEKDSAGRLRGVPTSQSTIADKTVVLQLLVDALIAANSSAFINSVEAAAISLGYNIQQRLANRKPGSRSQAGKVNIISSPASPPPVSWSNIVNGYSAVAHGDGYFSPNGKIFAKEIGARDVQSTLTSAFVNAVFSGNANLQFSDKDLRRIFLFVLSRVTSNLDYQLLVKLVKHHRNLAKLLNDRAEVFLTSDRYSGQAEHTYRQLVADNAIPVPATCQQLFQ